jgi:apolipoprotein N-acyltransferase
MESANQRTRWPLILGAATTSAIFLYFGTGLHPVWWLTWFAPLPLLWLAGRARSQVSWSRAALATFAAWFAGGANMWHYLRGRIELPILLVFLATTIPAVAFTIAVLIWRAFLLRRRSWSAVLWLPLFAVAVEYITAVASPNSTWGNIAYTQMDFLPLIQIASATGIWGISFVLWLVPSTIGLVLCSGVGGRAKKSIGSTVGALVAAVLLAGAIRLHAAPSASGIITAQLVSSDAPGDIFAASPERAIGLVSRYATAVPDAAAHPADVIVMPEKIALAPEASAQQEKAILATAAARSKAQLLAGLDEFTPNGRRNEALLFSSDGKIEEDYEKHHFVPGIEVGYVTGKDYPTMSRPSGVWGIAICKDMDFPALGREHGKRGVGLLLVPAWDFLDDDWLHDRMAVLRGVESGFTIVRDAKQGLQMVSDSRGRLLLDRRVRQEGFVVSTVQVPVSHVDTLYVRWGDWFAWLCCAGFVLLLVAIVARR